MSDLLSTTAVAKVHLQFVLFHLLQHALLSFFLFSLVLISIACEIGTYKNVTGDFNCTECPLLQTTLFNESSSSQECVCIQGYEPQGTDCLGTFFVFVFVCCLLFFFFCLCFFFFFFSDDFINSSFFLKLASLELTKNSTAKTIALPAHPFPLPFRIIQSALMLAFA